MNFTTDLAELQQMSSEDKRRNAINACEYLRGEHIDPRDLVYDAEMCWRELSTLAKIPTLSKDKLAEYAHVPKRVEFLAFVLTESLTEIRDIAKTIHDYTTSALAENNQEVA